jgi:hypothetical protein
MPMNPRLLRPTGQFTPRSIAGLEAWYNASDASSITVATGVDKWADRSGKGRDLLQSTPNNQPQYVTNGLNGRPIIKFDGDNDSLSASFSLSQPTTVFCVGNYIVNTGGFNLYDGTTANTMRHFVAGSGTIGMFAGTSLTSALSSGDIIGWRIWESIFNGSSSAIIRNGTTLNSGNAGSASPGGVRLAIFGNNASNPTNCEIAEFVLYTGVLSAAERSRVRSYLSRKYAIAVT